MWRVAAAENAAGLTKKELHLLVKQQKAELERLRRELAEARESQAASSKKTVKKRATKD